VGCENRGRSRPQESAAPISSPSPLSPKVGAAIPSMNCDIRWAASIFHARMLLMPRDGAIIFADLIGKLDLLQVACDSAGAMGAIECTASSVRVARAV